MAVLDVSAIDPELSERAHALTGALTTKSARAIEERFFREQFHREWIVAVVPPEGGLIGMLLAVDGDQRIVGANRAARRTLLLDDRGLQAGVSLWTSSSEISTSFGARTEQISARHSWLPAVATAVLHLLLRQIRRLVP